MISHLVHEDFERARRKARWRALLKRLRRCNNALLSFEEIRRGLRAQVQHYSGLRQVSIEQIVGSVSHYHDFDGAFLPCLTSTRGRWEGIDRAYYEDRARHRSSSISWVKRTSSRTAITESWSHASGARSSSTRP
jgi:hypothetical protein